jgi:hypothetical protein
LRYCALLFSFRGTHGKNGKEQSTNLTQFALIFSLSYFVADGLHTFQYDSASSILLGEIQSKYSADVWPSFVMKKKIT